MIKMTHTDFITLCAKVGILVENITNTEVTLKTSISLFEIDFDLHFPGRPEKTVGALLKINPNKLGLVTIIRTFSTLNLRECLDLYDKGINNWTIKLVESIPYDQLPLHLSFPDMSDLYKSAVLERLQKGT